MLASLSGSNIGQKSLSPKRKVGRPRKAEGEGRVKMFFSCPPDLAQAVNDHWQSEGYKDQSAYICALIRQSLSENVLESG